MIDLISYMNIKPRERTSNRLSKFGVNVCDFTILQMSKIKINNCDYKIHPMYDLHAASKNGEIVHFETNTNIGDLQKMDICDVVSVNLDKQDKKT